MTRKEAVELALHRAVRAEVPPFVRAIVAAIELGEVSIKVFHFPSAGFEPVAFGETVESEFDQVLPSGFRSLAFDRRPPKLVFTFHPADEYDGPQEGYVIIVDNPWASG